LYHLACVGSTRKLVIPFGGHTVAGAGAGAGARAGPGAVAEAFRSRIVASGAAAGTPWSRGTS